MIELKYIDFLVCVKNPQVDEQQIACGNSDSPKGWFMMQVRPTGSKT